MTNYKKIQFLSLLILVALASVGLADDPNEVIAQLTFEDGTVFPQWRPRRSAGIKPTWAASLAQRSPVYTHINGRAIPEAFSNYARGRRKASFSMKQLAFLMQHRDSALGGFGRRGQTEQHHPEDPNYVVVTLYATSREDAQNMAKAYVQLVVDHSNWEVRRHEEDIRKMSGRIALAEKRLPELEETLAAKLQSLEELKNQVPYRTTDEAMQAIGELNRMLNAIQIESAGIRARIEAIQEYQGDQNAPLAIRKNCPVLFIEESIALQGAEARRRTAGTLRQQANTFIDLNEMSVKMDTEKRNLTESLPKFRGRLRESQDNLAFAQEREPKILDNKVVISRPKP